MHAKRLLPIFLLAGCSTPAPQDEPFSLRKTVETYCIHCHDAATKSGGLDLAAVLDGAVERYPDHWEKVVRRLRGRDMPPMGKQRPDEKAYTTVLGQLEAILDKADAAKPNPGRTETIRRLTRYEYQNAVRDLLALEIDATALLPADEAGHGFDNVTVGTLSPSLIERYLTAAQKVARMAVGGPGKTPGGDTIRVPSDLSQEGRIDGLPFGTRGGAVIPYTFPRDGEYDVQIRLARDRNEHVEGLTESHDVEVLLDREPVKSITVKPPVKQDHAHADDHLKLHLSVKAGPHELGVTFRKNPTSLIETMRQPYTARFNLHRHPRQSPALYQVTITGPVVDKGPGDTPSRRRVLVATPRAAAEEEACARKVLSTLLRRAYRRPVTDADVDRVLPFYRDARKEADFDAGIESALAAVLVSREFLFRVESDPPGVTPGSAYRISDRELASRLSFFLWSSIPDDALLDLAEKGELGKPEVLERQVKRMLVDPRAKSLATNFAGQWLHLRNLDSITPDGRLYPDFDDNLRQAFRRETEELFAEVLIENRSLFDLLASDHTYVNERLAKHYGMPHVYGPQFRRVPVAGTDRGGLLRHGSVLTVTSYATRTSPVLRGKWVMENLLGSPPPAPPPNVPALDDNTVAVGLPVRERLKQHRANAACATCHNAIDPVGFALENYDAVGRWRVMEEGVPVEADGGLPDGRRFAGVSGLERAIREKPDVFAHTLTEKLLTYALGRGMEYFDGPALRAIVKRARADEYRFQTLIVAIVQSPPFQMRTSR